MTDNESPFQGLAEKIRGGKSPSTLELESRKPKLIISRKVDGTQGVGLANRVLLSYRNMIASVKFKIFVDDEQVGQIDNGERVTIEIEPGLRKIRLKADFAKSRQFCYEFENGDQLLLKCCAKLSGIALYR